VGDGLRGAPLSARSEARTSNGAASRQDPRLVWVAYHKESESLIFSKVALGTIF